MSTSLKLYLQTIISTNNISTNLAVVSTSETEGRCAAMPREDGKFQLLAGADGALRTVARGPPPSPTRLTAYVKILQHDRKTRLEDLWVRKTRIRHVRMDGIRTIETRTGRRT